VVSRQADVRRFCGLLVAKGITSVRTSISAQRGRPVHHALVKNSEGPGESILPVYRDRPVVTGLTPAVDLGLIYRRAEQTTERMEQAFHQILLNPENFAPGRLTVVVGHRPVLDAFGDIAEGDAVVFIRDHHAYRVVGKITVSEWLAAASDLSWLGRRASSGYTGH